MFYVHIDILKSLNILYLDILYKPFIVISARKILYHTLYTTVYLKMNPRVRNM